MAKVVVAGHICLDLLPALPEAAPPPPGTIVEVGALRAHPGGAVFNTGAALAAVGAEVSAVATIGADPLGGVLAELVADAGMTTDFAVDSERCTSYSIVVETPGVDRGFWHHVGANEAFDGRDVNLDDAELVHVGYPTVLPGLFADGGAPLADLLERARTARVATSLDFCFADPRTPAGRTDWAAILRRVLPLTDIVSPSIDDLVSMRICSDDSARGVEAAARALVDQGAGIALVSAGPRGAFLASGSAERLAACGALAGRLSAWNDLGIRVEPAPLDAPVSTTGAGDTLTAGLLFALLQGWAPVPAGSFASRLAAARIQGQDLAQVSFP